MSKKLRFTRSHAVLRMRRQLEENAYPRLQMGLLVALTGAAGWLFSFALLAYGVHNMALRYPLALAMAYAFFLCLLWLWLRTEAQDYADAPDLVSVLPMPELPGAVSTSMPMPVGGGGDFAGGGASAAFDAPSLPMALESDALPGVGDAAEAVAGADELAIPIIVVVGAIGLALASLYVVWLAPALFAELMVDGAISYTLYRRLRREDTRHWFGTALRHTALPFAITAVFLACAGAALNFYAPGARSLPEAMAPRV